MNSHVVYLMVVCVACAFSATPAEKSGPEKVITESKPKREVSIPNGSGYHGPSYKYLPPSSSASLGGYDSYSSGQHGSYAEVGAYDFGGSTGGHDIGHLVSTSPKVQTYIVQTQPAHENHGAEGHAAGFRYAGPSASFSGAYSRHQSGLGSSYAHHGHGAVHKVKAIVIPTRGFSAGSHGGSVFDRFGGSNAGLGYSKGLSGGSHFFSGGSSNHVGGSYAGNSYATKHEGFGGGSHSARIGVSDHGYSSDHESNIDVQSLAASHDSSDYNRQGGYSFDIPDTSHSHESHNVPSDSHGGPVNNGNQHYHVSESTGENLQPPSYASGHKGLGHFGFIANKPQALHTSIIDSNKYQSSYSNHGAQLSSHIAETPLFKPSLFLGASHENGAAGYRISTDYGAPAPAANYEISTQYSPPTSDGYDYPPPSALYGAPSHSQSSAEYAGPAHEPESAYLPPSTQPHASYLPSESSSSGDNYVTHHH